MSSKASALSKSDYTTWSEFTPKEQQCQRRIAALCIASGLILLIGTAIGAYLIQTKVDNAFEADMGTILVSLGGGSIGVSLIGVGSFGHIQPNPDPHNAHVQVALQAIFSHYLYSPYSIRTAFEAYPLTWMVRNQILTPEQGDEVKEVVRTIRELTYCDGYPRSHAARVRLQQLEEKWAELKHRVSLPFNTETDKEAASLALKRNLKKTYLEGLRFYGFRGMVENGYLTEEEAAPYQELLKEYFVALSLNQDFSPLNQRLRDLQRGPEEVEFDIQQYKKELSQLENSAQIKMIRAELQKLEAEKQRKGAGRSEPPPYTE